MTKPASNSPEYMQQYRAENREKYREYQRKYRAENREKINERNRAYRAANPETYRASRKKYYEANREMENVRTRRAEIKRKYGITMEERDAMLAAQGGVCAICGTDKPASGRNKAWHVDHCHNSEKVRGILCNSCNVMLGNARDNPAVLRRAAEYLERDQ